MDSDAESYDEYDGDYDEPEEWDDVDDNVNKKPSFETLTTDDIVQLMNQYIEEVNAIVQMPATATRILLSHTKWQKEELLVKLTADDSDEFFKKAHVLNPFAEDNSPKAVSNVHECNICLTELPQDAIVGLTCGHKSCKDCFGQYLTYKVVDDGKADSISCTDTKCRIVVDDLTIIKFLTTDKAKQMYQHLMATSFVEYNRNLKWCPSPGCTYAIKVNQILTHQQNCTCKCGHSFCFSCGDASHDPIPCALMDNWKRNSNDDTILYLTKHTKECPKCFCAIEKNGGCNRMICRKCTHPFCWLCYGTMTTYDHQCNQFKEVNEDRNQKNRWQHYFQRYSTHKESLKCEERLLIGDNTIDRKMKTMQFMGKSWNDVQFLKKSVEILCESRKQLMFTYIFAYYIEDHHQKVIFEANQNDLESATEALSQYLEQNITENNIDTIIQDVMHKSNYCERRQKTMQEHIYEGFEKDWWSFTTNLWSRLKKMG
ncbi:potential E3 ubiquitin-protein ligase ariadne-1-like [Contarinia nasturtii]|uniref:potential E3 ubiquitin-protein ligase ariadne-1-like n=1 Tax=Contarinia nasturtii TaxID=265458 RepID=UPI0012D4C131|nr:potential E3 ubiquitin-protein ligase ariadne-1-like [Contarinia nasturtii]